MTINVALTQTQHTFDIVAPEGETFEVQAIHGDTVNVRSVTVRITVTPDGAIAEHGTYFTATGHQIEEALDGTTESVPRRAVGHNLSRIPLDLRLALLEHIRGTLGRIHDPNDQMLGYTLTALPY